MRFEGHQKTSFWNRVSKIDFSDIILHRNHHFYLICEGEGLGGSFWRVLLGRVWGGDFDEF